MILHGLQLMNGDYSNIFIRENKIGEIFSPYDNNPIERNIYFKDCFVFPGLINSHDHLDYNLFPQLGNHIYKNYLEWGPDIHQQNNEIIEQVQNIPKELRTKWGVYKNLIAGVTTVVQHGEKLTAPENLITIFSQCTSLHSVKLEKHWKRRLNKPFAGNQPFVIHAGEGTDIASCNEIDELLKWNIFRRKLIAIHGVAMNERQAEKFEALVWCPDSNHFLLNATARIDKLKSFTKILFGTDATVSANWNIWEHLRLARATKMLSDTELINAVTEGAADVWQLEKTGLIKEGYYADLVIAKGNRDSFFSTNPEDIQLILHKGKIVLFDASMLTQLGNIPHYSVIYVNNVKKYVIGDVPALIKEIRRHIPAIKLPIDVD
ncbi:Cytosine/adenosine deaminase [Chitinophaga sp. CF118]|uniref:amidohydrolase family protein n=1 Tax=Chitinophaga sp. CF118 TaxID=1884367 RepID=UPI0008EF5839|nr:amidohydrolase family protein [Chitinophaga sp. CF118]SFF06779.1 Cytosine/adenosine deaminase [Chitinophaga sp. CF118]